MCSSYLSVCLLGKEKLVIFICVQVHPLGLSFTAWRVHLYLVTLSSKSECHTSFNCLNCFDCGKVVDLKLAMATLVRTLIEENGPEERLSAIVSQQYAFRCVDYTMEKVFTADTTITQCIVVPIVPWSNTERTNK